MQPDSMPKNVEIQRRSIAAIVVWALLFIALVAGITMNAALYANGGISDETVTRRLMYALMCFVMMSLVFIIEWIFRVRFPLVLELAAMFFAFFALAGGTVFNFYRFDFYDKLLHTLSGPLFASVGLCVADLLLKNQPLSKRKAVAFVFIALFFSLAVGYLWEIFEYTVDSVIPGYNNQGWLEGILETYENGTYLVSDNRGTALNDTMWDMICNLCGTGAFLFFVACLCVPCPKRLSAFSVNPLKKLKYQEKLSRKNKQ